MMIRKPNHIKFSIFAGKFFSISGCCVTALLVSSFVQGVVVDDLYKASVVVNSMDDVTEMNQAFTTAMREVLVKVSGNAEVLNLNRLRRASDAPRSYVDSFEYKSTQERLPVVADQQQPGLETVIEMRDVINLEISFSEQQIRGLLDENGIPLWPDNRPETLVWVVRQEELSERQILGSGIDNELVRLINEQADLRGLPLLFPLMDFEDQQAINADELWNLDEESIQQASERYQVESILLMRIFSSFSGEHLGRAVYIFRERILSKDVYEDNLASFIELAINLTVEELSAYYSVLISGTNSNIVVNMKVEAVGSTRNYAELMNYVSELADVNSVSIASVSAQTINLKLSTGGQLRQLVETIALDNNLIPLADVIREDNQVFMHYQWSSQ